MTVVQQTPSETDLTEEPVSTKTRIIIQHLTVYGQKLEDVTQAVEEIKSLMKGRESLIIRAVKQWLSLVDPNWKK